jgi:hypothetical protein
MKSCKVCSPWAFAQPCTLTIASNTCRST